MSPLDEVNEVTIERQVIANIPSRYSPTLRGTDGVGQRLFEALSDFPGHQFVMTI
jgi:hypothetical protein